MDQVKKMTNDVLKMIREPFKINEVQKKYPFKYEESMNSVLLQELARFNKLIETIKQSLKTLQLTLEGKIVTNAEMDAIQMSVLNNSIPDKWQAKSYPSRKPMMSYVADLKSRLDMLDHWIKFGKPNVYWISGFYFTQSFLTGVKQNYARAYKYPIDRVNFKFKVFNKEQSEEESALRTSPPEHGCYLEGLFLEGAAWDDANCVLKDSLPKIIHEELPIIHFIPTYEPQNEAEMTAKKEETSKLAASALMNK